MLLRSRVSFLPWELVRILNSCTSVMAEIEQQDGHRVP